MEAQDQGITIPPLHWRKFDANESSLPTRHRNYLMTRFIRIPKKEWLFAASVESRRLKKLLNKDGFRRISDCLASKAKIVECKRAAYRTKKGYFRIEITIQANARTIDAFFNSRCGYRAQFYNSPKKGEEANAFAISKLLPVVRSFLQKHPKRTLPLDWVNKSLSDKEAKIWIYPGNWIRPFNQDGQKKYRNLCVERWAEEKQPPQSQEHKLSKLSKLAPDCETRLHIKGGWMKLKGQPILQKQLKKNHKLRSKQLYNHGFTHAG